MKRKHNPCYTGSVRRKLPNLDSGLDLTAALVWQAPAKAYGSAKDGEVTFLERLVEKYPKYKMVCIPHSQVYFHSSHYPASSRFK